MTWTQSKLIVLLAATASVAACAGVKRPLQQATPAPTGAVMWVEPVDMATRDLYYGPWGAEHAPDPNAVYTFQVPKRSGVNLGMTVTDAQDREWSVKTPYPGNLDSEAPVEVVISRLLSAVGYRQPPVYYLPTFTLKDDWGTRTEVGGRFRLKLDTLKEVSPWRWDDNPFVGTPAYQGLIVLLMMFNSSDLKDSNNSLYEFRNGDLVEQWYVARDLGSALGDTERFAPRKNNLAAFERAPFILGVNGPHVEFAYKSWYKNLVRDRISPADVAWASELLGRLTDQQWHDAFRAGGYQPDEAGRFIAKIKSKLAEGRGLTRLAARN